MKTFNKLNFIRIYGALYTKSMVLLRVTLAKRQLFATTHASFLLCAVMAELVDALP